MFWLYLSSHFKMCENNGSKQKLININDIEKYLNMGYEFQATLPNGKAVMKLPF